MKIADTKIQVRQRFGKAKSFNKQFRLNSPMHNKISILYKLLIEFTIPNLSIKYIFCWFVTYDFIFLIIFLTIIGGDDEGSCSSESDCPDFAPICSQWGYCQTTDMPNGDPNAGTNDL